MEKLLSKADFLTNTIPWLFLHCWPQWALIDTIRSWSRMANMQVAQNIFTKNKSNQNVD